MSVCQYPGCDSIQFCKMLILGETGNVYTDLSVLFLILTCESTIISIKISPKISSIFAAKHIFVLKASVCHNHSQCTLNFFKIFFWCEPFLKSLLNLLQYCFCFMFWFFDRKACGILAPRPGIEPIPQPHTLEGEALTTGPPGKSLNAL